MQDSAEEDSAWLLATLRNSLIQERKRAHLTYREVNDLIPQDVHSPEDLDDLFATIGTQGIDVLVGQPKLPSSALEKRLESEV